MEFPEDIICIIMAKLPVKSLLRFKIVSKAWYNLIQDPHFCESYTKNCVSQSSNSFIFWRKNYYYRFKELSLVDKQNQGWKKTAALTLNHRFLPDSDWKIVSTCNGLLCLANRRGGVCSSFYEIGIIIYNPITREGAMLPKLYLTWDNRSQQSMGINFGYDAKTNKYKVAIMCSFPMIHIIMVGEKSWRKLDYSHAGGPYFCDKTLTASSNEEFFWFMPERGEILVLDISDEKFRGIDMDEVVPGFCHFFFVYGKRITVIITSTEQKLGTTRMHAWELIDSKKGIWKRQEMHDKIFTQKVDVISTAGGDHLLLRLSPPYVSSSTEPPSKFVIYNPISGKVSSILSPSDPELYDVFSFVPTLVSVSL